MAFIDGQDDELVNGQAQPGQGQNPLVGQGSTQVGSGDVSQGATGSGGAGAGGAGGWTNIQSYLKANEGDTGSSQALNKTVSGQFDQEKDKYTNDSAAFLQGAQGQVDKAKISNEEADNAIKQAGSQYSWGAQNDEYKNTVNKFQNALTSQYQGPKDYTYGFSAQTQDYGNNLKDNQGFDSLMNQVYSGAAKKPLTSGQFQLQKQLDVNNQGLVDTRNQLNTKYSDLTKGRDETVANTTNALGGLEKQYRTNQNSLRDYLGNQSNALETQIGQAEADARAAYNKEYTTGQSSLTDPFDQHARTYAAEQFGHGNAGEGQWLGTLDNGEAGYNWQDMQQFLDGGSRINDQGYVGASAIGPGGGFLGDPYAELAQLNALQENYRGQAGQHINDFYAAQDAKYGNTADEQDRGFNAIQDFLNSETKRKEQGFRVRG